MGRYAASKIVERYRGEVPSSSHAAQDKEYNAYLDQLHLRENSVEGEAIRQMLAAASDRRFRQFLKVMSDPSTKRYSLAAIAKWKSVEIDLDEFIAWFSDAQKLRSIAIAQQNMPALTADLIADAKRRDDVCGRCDGYGQEFDERAKEDKYGQKPLMICRQCNGTGVYAKPGDSHARDTLLRMAGVGMEKKQPAAGVTINFRSMESAVGSMSAITFDVASEAVEPESGPAA